MKYTLLIENFRRMANDMGNTTAMTMAAHTVSFDTQTEAEEAIKHMHQSPPEYGMRSVLRLYTPYVTRN